MNINNKLFYLLSFVLIFSIGCEDDEAAAADPSYDPAGEYVFPSRLVEGSSSVSYTGQVVRNMLHSDLKTLTDLAMSPGHPYITYDLMNKYYNHQDESDMMESFVSSGTACEAVYTNIATGKNLSGKCNSDELKGWPGVNAEAAVQLWMTAIADNYAGGVTSGAGTVTSAEGLNYSQMINKTLYGAVAYDQAFSYLSNYDETMPDNVDPKSTGGSYTVAEHKWDEAFGYFGARRDFLTPGDVGDCVDLTSEHNFGWASYATKRDNDTENIAYRNGVMFKADIFNAFVDGRAIIHNEGTVGDLAEHMTTIRTRWEQLCAANVIHYIHSVKDDMASDLTSTSVASSDEAADYNKHWAEMRGFIISLQYNLTNLSESDLDDIVTHVGIAPVYPGDTGYADYEGKLDQVKTILSGLF